MNDLPQPTSQSRRSRERNAAAERQPRSRRERPAKAPLSRESIIDAAIGIIDAAGVEALSMRKVAQVLDTGAASLYVYFRDREDLLHSVIDRVSMGVTLPSPDAGTWQERVRAVMLGSLAALRAHRGLAAVVLGTLPGDPHEPDAAEDGQYRIMSYLVDCLREGGLMDSQIAWLIDSLTMLVVAMAAERDEIDRQVGIDEPDQLERWFSEMLDRMPLHRHPSIGIFAYHLSAATLEDRVAWSIDVMLAGAASVPPPPVIAGSHPLEHLFQVRLEDAARQRSLRGEDAMRRPGRRSLS